MFDPLVIPKILVRGPNFIGDSVMALPTYRTLRSMYPKGRLVLIASPATVELSHLYQLFDEVWKIEGRGYLSLLNMALKARKEKFDLGISFPASVSSALLLWLSGIQKRIGFAEFSARPFYHEVIPWKGRASGQHKSDLYKQILAAIPKSGVTKPYLSLHEVPSTKACLENPYFVVAPGASIDLRQWPHTVSFIHELRRLFPQHKILIVGSKKDKHWSACLRDLKDPQIVDQIGKTSILEVIDLCRGADQVLAMDSGVAHLAATLAGAQTTVIFGPGDPVYIKPKGPVTEVRLENLACSPCEKSYCTKKFGYKACLENLPVEKVLKAFQNL